MDAPVRIRSVWADNVHHEIIAIIKQAALSHPFISLSINLLHSNRNHQRRGRIPPGASPGDPNSNYATLRATVGASVLQVGLALSDEGGNLPTCKETGQPCAWEFNLRVVDRRTGEFAPWQHGVLRASAVDAEESKRRAIDPSHFSFSLFGASILMRSRIRWVVFKGGLDFGGLLKLLRGEDLPRKRDEWFQWLQAYFPSFYDVMHLTEQLRLAPAGGGGSLDGVAEKMGVGRDGQHTQGAGSDSLLVLRVFLKMKQESFGGGFQEHLHGNVLFGFCKRGEHV
ncbi:putative CCR4-associated factor 1-like protein 2 [Nymphaea thermarum]|nr:putative CCR4-associated factor 1-like protein 2 [Nymphaea thermarum]